MSGEVLMGKAPFGISPDELDRLTDEVIAGTALGVQLAIVIGGGNFFRGLSTAGRQFSRAAADSVGMLATTMNGLALQDVLERKRRPAALMSALEMPRVAEPFVRRNALRHLDEGRTLILVAGTGHPYFTTDSGAALRALEIGADVLLKGTKVDGVFTTDPARDPAARFLARLSFQEVLEKGLAVLDATAVALCRDNRLPLHVFNIRVPGNLVAVLRGEAIGSIVT
jgi:uridylate kinase